MQHLRWMALLALIFVQSQSVIDSLLGVLIYLLSSTQPLRRMELLTLNFSASRSVIGSFLGGLIIITKTAFKTDGATYLGLLSSRDLSDSLLGLR